MKEFHTAEFEHPSGAPVRDYPEDDSPENIEAVIFTTQLCFFPPWKELIPFASCQITYQNHPTVPDTVQASRAHQSDFLGSLTGAGHRREWHVKGIFTLRLE